MGALIGVITLPQSQGSPEVSALGAGYREAEVKPATVNTFPVLI